MDSWALGVWENWSEIGRGYYRYAISDKMAYEVVVLYRDEGTNILNATATLYLARELDTEDGSRFERGVLVDSDTVQGCLYVVVGDFGHGINT